MPSHSPDGTSPLPVATVGGWAGTAITNASAHKYISTARPLSSAPDDNYSATLWVRPSASPNGTSLVNTISSGNVAGFRITMSGRTLVVTVADGGQLFNGSVVLSADRWHSIALRTTGLGKGIQVFADGQSQVQITPPTGNGFGPQQLQNMEIGPFSAIDLDDLRFYNRSLSDAEMCTLAARGTINPASGLCTPLSPGIELDFEGGVVKDTGFWRLPFVGPQATPQFVATKTGTGIQLPTTVPPWGYSSGLNGQISSAPGRSFSLWVNQSDAAGTVWDTTRQCAIGGPPDQCGIKLTTRSRQLDVFVGSVIGNGQTKTIPLAAGMNSIVVTERRSGSTTVDVRVFVNGGTPTVLPVGQGDVYESAADGIAVVQPANLLVDEYELWPVDLAKDPEALCENGFDGEFDPATGTCNLTAN